MQYSDKYIEQLEMRISELNPRNRKTITDDFLTNVVAFHCHQIVEKTFKAILLVRS